MANPMSITVVRGRPDETELAAVTAVLLALAGRAGHPYAAGAATATAYAGWTIKNDGHRTAAAWPGR
ncbi:acyl-CoA carboxylase subunit epsilon [Streptomyces sp. NPDC086519]|uniref:acyl-CoA carboxylase subunit epsilon n=1 Tax=Streptomyces sp. NPDC086519 TaxID=3154863 RepID=UPI00342B5AD8